MGVWEYESEALNHILFYLYNVYCVIKLTGMLQVFFLSLPYSHTPILPYFP